MASVKLDDVRGMTADLSAKLKDKGLGGAGDLLDALASPSARKKLADEVGVAARDLLEVGNRLDLSRVSGIAGAFGDLLEKAGVDTVPELAMRNAENLHAKMQEVNEKLGITKALPSVDQVKGWVEQAKELPRKINY